MYLYGGLPRPVALGILLLFALYLGLYHALFGGLLALIHRQTGLIAALFAAPFLWVAIELARARVTGFPWDLLGYAQVDNGLLTQLAPVGGVLLLSFIVAAVCALFAAACLLPRHLLRPTFAAAIVLATCLQLGTLYQSSQDPAAHHATLLQENLAVGAPGRDVEVLSMQEKYRQFVSLSHSAKIVWLLEPGVLKMGAADKLENDFIIWPEAPADFATTDPTFRAQLGALAAQTHTPVVVGSIGVDADPSAELGYREYGSAAFFNSSGAYTGRYDKIHRVPWGEYVPYKQLFSFAGKLISGVGNMEAGTEHKVFRANDHNFSVFICYESIFGDEVRTFVNNGAEVLINISDDGWYGDTGAPWQHLDMARMRAIENRRWILRDTNTGVTTAIDPHGRGIFIAPRHVRAAFNFPFNYRSDVTFYTRHGDWFAWLCVIVSAGLLAMGFTRRSEVH